MGGLTGNQDGWGGMKSRSRAEGHSQYPWPLPLQLWQIMLLAKFMGLGDEGADGVESPVEGADGDAVDFPSIVGICDRSF